MAARLQYTHQVGYPVVLYIYGYDIRPQALLRYHSHVTKNRYQSGNGNGRAKILEILKRLVMNHSQSATDVVVL